MATTAGNEQQVVRLGRLAIATQGVLYAVVGLLAVQVSRGDGAEADQRGALETVARQPFGRVLLVVIAVGLAAHALWRGMLAVRGEPGSDEDAGSAAKRLANGARAALYVGLTVAAVRVLTSSGGSGGSGEEKEKTSTSTVLTWPAGKWIVIAAGLAVIGAGVWNGYRAVTRSFTDALDLGSLDETRRRTVTALGVAGYLARAGVYSLVGWFLVNAGLQEDPGETRGLDASLHELATTDQGPRLLLVLAVGMVLFGVFRVVDASLRRPCEITHA